MPSRAGGSVRLPATEEFTYTLNTFFRQFNEYSRVHRNRRQHNGASFRRSIFMRRNDEIKYSMRERVRPSLCTAFGGE